MAASPPIHSHQTSAPPRRRRASRRQGRFVVLVALSIIGNVFLGCSGDTTNPVSFPATQLFGALQFNIHAINLDTAPPYNTVQLTATALNAAGTRLAGVDSAVHYRTLDSSTTVTATGLVTAHYVTGGTQVIASLTTAGVTHADTAMIEVTDSVPPAPIATLSIRPGVGDSAKCAISLFGGTCATLPINVTDSQGDSVCTVASCPLIVAFTSSNPLIATIDNFGNITSLDTGRVTFYATTYAYGVIKQDSLPYIIGYPIFSYFTADLTTPLGSRTPILSFTPSTQVVGTGAVVLIRNISPNGDSVDIVFDDSAAVIGGNTQVISGLIDGNTGQYIAQFSTPGVYTYRSRRYGSQGKIIVKASP